MGAAIFVLCTHMLREFVKARTALNDNVRYVKPETYFVPIASGGRIKHSVL